MKNRQEHWKERIYCDPKMMGGEPVIKGTRVTVAVIVGSLADGLSQEDLLKVFPQIQKEDIRSCLRYAAESAKADMSYDFAV